MRLKNCGFKILLAFVIGISIFSCNEDASKTIDSSLFGYEYFPIGVGKYWIYQVDSTTVDDLGGTILESRTFIREEITEVFLNAKGDSVYRIERSESDNRIGGFIVKDVWTADMNPQAAFRTEENLRFAKMIFPINLKSSWEGNLFDAQTGVLVAGETVAVYKDWGDYQVENKGIATTVGGKVYDNVLTIIQADHDFGIERRFSREQYAAGVGLIRKEMEIFDTQCTTCTEPWLEKAQFGFQMNMFLVESN